MVCAYVSMLCTYVCMCGLCLRYVRMFNMYVMCVRYVRIYVVVVYISVSGMYVCISNIFVTQECYVKYVCAIR